MHYPNINTAKLKVIVESNTRQLLRCVSSHRYDLHVRLVYDDRIEVQFLADYGASLTERLADALTALNDRIGAEHEPKQA